MQLFEIHDPEGIRQRVFAKPRVSEFVVLVAASIVAAFFAINFANGQAGAVDYAIFLNAVRGDYAGFFYAPWILPVFAIFDLLPIAISYFLWNMFNILMLWLALRVFGGNTLIAILSYQMLYCLFYGQIVGLVAGALALMWWALSEKRYWLAGLALALAVVKIQLGFPLAVILLLLADISWGNRIKVGLISFIPALGSLLLYPSFITDAYNAYLSTPPDTLGNISLWRYIGAWSLILWLPTIFVPLTHGKRIIAVFVTVAMTLPYFQQTDLLLLFALPVGWIGLLGNIGYMMAFIGWKALPMLGVIPVITYVAIFIWHFLDLNQPKPKRESNS